MKALGNWLQALGPVALAGLVACSPRPLLNRDAPPPAPGPLPDRVAGANIRPVGDLRRGYGTFTARQTLQRLARLGVNTIAILIEGRLESASDTSVDGPTRGELDRALAALEDARTLGFSTVVIPHLYVKDGTWRGFLDWSEPSEAATRWWDSYSQFIERTAELAAAGQASALALGVELKGMSAKPGPHRAMVKLSNTVREFYQGELTYAANWDEAAEVSFWSVLDFVGVNAYYPLKPNPALGAQKVAKQLSHLAHTTRKEVLVLEVGYRSSPDPHLEPWAWPEQTDGVVDEAAQARAWQAILKAWLGAQGVRGLMVWVIPTDPDDPASEPRHGFSPLNKPSESIIGTAFQKFTRSPDQEYPFGSTVQLPRPPGLGE